MDSFTRFDTFAAWPPQIRPTAHQLSEAGFIYLGIGDRVKCNTCGLELYSWKEKDDAFEQHMKFSKNCEFVNNHLANLFRLKVSNQSFKWVFVGSPPKKDDDLIIYKESDIWYDNIYECMAAAKHSEKSIDYPDCYGCELHIRVKNS